jgi:hypothetical protein
MEPFRKLTETLARKTTRRNLFGKGAGVATGALLGVAAGSVMRPATVGAGGSTVCAFPGPACGCPGSCKNTGVCNKPCIVMTVYYASGCWVTNGFTCCDCDCNGAVPGFPSIHVCGCGSDYHNNPANCPSGP